VRSRCSELNRQGLVQQVGKCRSHRTNRSVTLWGRA
jgi:hypothetical protein